MTSEANHKRCMAMDQNFGEQLQFHRIDTSVSCRSCKCKDRKFQQKQQATKHEFPPFSSSFPAKTEETQTLKT